MNHAQKALSKLIITLLTCLIILFPSGADSANSEDKTYHHVVVLGDPHLPGKYLETKERVIQEINSWADVDMVSAVGDICEISGSDPEYAAVKRFFSKLDKPLCPITGNHDFFHADQLNSKGRRPKSTPASRDAKLSKFRETFGLENIYYTKKVGKYLLVFLSAESLGYSAEMSEKQLRWLRSELEENRNLPTIIFFHAPLKGTLRSYNKYANTPRFVAQPSAKIHDLLMKNPQVFLWVSGHTHTSPKEESFASSINLYENRLTNIHNTDMNRKTIWTNSLFLHSDRVVIKTYDHAKGIWLSNIERTIRAPRL